MDELHYRYWLGILLAILILVLTTEWSSVDGFLDLLNTAVALSSLLLALVAITYAMISGGQILRQLGGFESTAAQLREAATSIAGASESLHDHAGRLPPMMLRVDQGLGSLRDSIAELSSDAFATEVAEFQSADGKSYFTVDRLRWFGLVTLLSLQTGKPVTLVLWPEIVVPEPDHEAPPRELIKQLVRDGIEEGVGLGALLAWEAAGLLDVHVEGDTMTVTGMADDFRIEAESLLANGGGFEGKRFTKQMLDTAVQIFNSTQESA